MDFPVIGNSPVNYLYVPEKLKNLERTKYYQGDDFKILPNTTFHLVAGYLKRRSVVLDVGCSSGYFGMYLVKTLNATVYGVDVDREALSIASQRGYREVYGIDLDEDLEKFKHVLEKVKPDYVLCLDVVEHLKNASDFMKLLLDFIRREDSEVIVSIPNIGHIDIIYNLLMGRFNYSMLGILDNTHLRFFTRSSFREWIAFLAEDEGFKPEIKLIGRTEASFCLSLGEKSFQKDVSRLQHIAKRAGNEDIFTVQFVFSITKGE
ncbi:class I SAM-dependent methyltransferase [Desulfurobacterium sp.]